MTRNIIIYGGKGALGTECIKKFKSAQYKILSVDLSENTHADKSIIVDTNTCFKSQTDQILSQIENYYQNEKVDAVICVAGGWAGGNTSANDFIDSCDSMLKQSVWTSCIASKIGSKHLKNDGVLILTGSVPALGPCENMIGYGMAKAAVHSLTKSVAKDPTFPGSSVLSILPVTLDTPMNRKYMSNSDFSSWTPLYFVTECE